MKKVVFIVVIFMFGTLFAAVLSAQSRKIGMTKAREIASKQVDGKIKSSELEKEHGKWIYSFDVRNKKGSITEVNIDAYTGAVISVEEENAQKEAAEKRAEKTERRKGKNR